VTGELLVFDIQVLLLQLLEESGFLCNDRIKGRVLVISSEKTKRFDGRKRTNLFLNRHGKSEKVRLTRRRRVHVRK
jgi:hypothetical protein